MAVRLKTLIKIANRTLGGIGEDFIRHQCTRLGFHNDLLEPEEVEELAHEAMSNSLLIVGRVRAQRLERQILTLIAELS